MHRVWLLVLVCALPIACSAQPAGDTLTSTGIVVDGFMDDDGIWFELAAVDQRFILDTDSVRDADAFFKALQESASSGRGVDVYFDASAGYFEAGDKVPRYLVRSIEYDGRTFAGTQRLRRKNIATDPAEAALASGVAYYSGGRPKTALRHLDASLRAGSLNPGLKALALRTRGNAILESIWSVREVLTEEDDRQLIRALEDFRAWAELEPESMEAQTDIGYALRDLGAYDEALEVFRSILRRWPDQMLQSATRIGATYRILGDYQQALEVIDELVANHGPQEGMKFHYHRGWTLNLLGRYEEALAEFTEGLETQPDYSYAFQKRACSNAMLGRIEEALADQQRFNAAMQAYWRERHHSPASIHETKWVEAVIKELERALESGRKDPVPAPCGGGWNAAEKKRERSRLLPARERAD